MLQYCAFQGELVLSRQEADRELSMSLSWQDVEDTRLSWSFEMDLWSFYFAAIPINLCFMQFLKLCFLLVFRRGS